MSALKATPGPWEVRGQNVYAEGRCTALLNWKIRDKVDDTNAHLIAAAPDLYRSVENAIEAIEKGDLYERMCCDGRDCGCYGSSNSEFVVHHLRAVLAKARGES